MLTRVVTHTLCEPDELQQISFHTCVTLITDKEEVGKKRRKMMPFGDGDGTGYFGGGNLGGMPPSMGGGGNAGGMFGAPGFQGFMGGPGIGGYQQAMGLG